MRTESTDENTDNGCPAEDKKHEAVVSVPYPTTEVKTNFAATLLQNHREAEKPFANLIRTSKVE